MSKDATAEVFVKSLAQWSMTDSQWRSAGCPTPGTLDYAVASARSKPDGGETYVRLKQALRDLEL